MVLQLQALESFAPTLREAVDKQKISPEHKQDSNSSTY